MPVARFGGSHGACFAAGLVACHLSGGALASEIFASSRSEAAWRPTQDVGEFVGDPKLRQQLLDEANAHVQWITKTADDRFKAATAAATAAAHGHHHRGDRHVQIDAAAILTEVSMEERDRFDAMIRSDEKQATRVFTENPMTQFYFDNSNIWRPWPGLSKEFQLDADCVVLIQYQTATRGGFGNLFSRVLVDSVPVQSTKSASGNMKYAGNFGFLVQYLSQGRHNVSVEYLSGFMTSSVTFDAGGLDWQTRALNVIVAPTVYSDTSIPQWRFRISSADVFMTVPGLRQNLELDEATPVFALYTFVAPGRNSFFTCRLLVNGLEQPSSRSVAGQNAYAQLTGFYADTLQPGKYEFVVSYRTPGKSNYYDPEGVFEAQGLYLIQLPGAVIYKKYDDGAFKLVEEEWSDWPGLIQEFTLPSPRTILATYYVGLNSAGGQLLGNVRSRMLLNGVEQKQCRYVCGDTSYCALMGLWTGTVAAGKYEFRVQYKASRLMNGKRMAMPQGNKDWANRAMNVVILPRPGVVA
eukprot:TRINITY_DN121506_c0_g1_i1.p1 TRINITY_DN121506_c0_g1~~TRINITY_DN121506_c0_g1_i1.p1  ORF type:complete len:556 (+),score=111.70 TRINITY_DN121506_c0_g1_i1:98-1669(+)